jgi:RNA polymerase sigma factor (sigma-70 family)
MAHSSQDLLDLLAQSLAGNELAAKRLAGRLAPAIREGVVCALFFADVRGKRSRRGPDDVDDFMQDTFELLFKEKMATLRNFDATTESSNLEAYVCHIAKRVTVGRIRLFKSGRAETPTAPEEMPERMTEEMDPEIAALNRELLEYVLGELNLDEEGRELFTLHFIDGLDGREICDLIGMSSTAFWKWTSRIREKCRNIIKKSGNGGAK